MSDADSIVEHGSGAPVSGPLTAGTARVWSDRLRFPRGQHVTL